MLSLCNATFFSSWHCRPCGSPRRFNLYGQLCPATAPLPTSSHGRRLLDGLVFVALLLFQMLQDFIQNLRSFSLLRGVCPSPGGSEGDAGEEEKQRLQPMSTHNRFQLISCYLQPHSSPSQVKPLHHHLVLLISQTLAGHRGWRGDSTPTTRPLIHRLCWKQTAPASKQGSLVMKTLPTDPSSPSPCPKVVARPI